MHTERIPLSSRADTAPGDLVFMNTTTKRPRPRGPEFGTPVPPRHTSWAHSALIVSAIAALISGCASAATERVSAPEPAAGGLAEVGRSAVTGTGQALEPGTYRTTQFTPALVFSVPIGWTDVRDQAGDIRLQRLGDLNDEAFSLNNITVYQSVFVAAADCSDAREPGVGRSAKEIVDVLRNRDGIEVFGESVVTVGRLAGYALNVQLDPAKATACQDRKHIDAAPLFQRAWISPVHVVLGPTATMRLIVLDWRDSNVVIAVSAYNHYSLERYMKAAGPHPRRPAHTTAAATPPSPAAPRPPTPPPRRRDPPARARASHPERSPPRTWPAAWWCR